MGERTMSDALASSSVASPATSDTASKRRAIDEPEVNAFIRQGNSGSAPLAAQRAQPVRPSRQPDVQLNTKIPVDLHQRARRAVFESQMSNADPNTIQDLVSQALQAELRRLGF